MSKLTAVLVSVFILLIIQGVSFAEPKFPTPPSEQERRAAEQRGSQEAREINSKLANPQAIDDTLSAPMVSTGVGINPLNGKIFQCSNTKRTFKTMSECQSKCSSGTCMEGAQANLTEPSSSDFLEISIRPNPTTGDLDYVYVRQDTDFQNGFDFEGNVANPIISGICVNGYISCPQGSFNLANNSCTYRRWSTDANHRIISMATTYDKLAGCYCINNSCGKNLVNINREYVLETLGIGITEAVQSDDIRTVITKAKLDENALTVKYYGQKSGGAVKTQYSSGKMALQSGVDNPEELGYLPDTISTEGTKQFNQQISNPDSMAYLMMNNMSAKEQHSEPYSCQITRDVHINTRTIDNYCYTKGNRVDGNFMHWSDLPPWLNSTEECVPNGGGYSVGDSHNYLDIGTIVGAECTTGQPGNNPMRVGTRKESCTGSCYYDYQDEDSDAWCKMWKYWLWETYEDDPPQILTSNGCTRSDLATACKLKDEMLCTEVPVSQADKKNKCVYTMREFQLTGLVPPSSCRQKATNVTTYSYCATGSSFTIKNSLTGQMTPLGTGNNNNWFAIMRTYICDTGSEKVDTSNERKRLETIHGDLSVDAETGNVKLKDLLQPNPDGSCPTGYSLNGGACYRDMDENVRVSGETYDDCEITCSVVTYKSRTESTATGDTGESKTNPNPNAPSGDPQKLQKVYSIRPCNKTNGNYSCPIDVSKEEFLDKDCACQNDFGEVISTMSYAVKAGKSMICDQDD
jgi:hypothetical protein